MFRFNLEPDMVSLSLFEGRYPHESLILFFLSLHDLIKSGDPKRVIDKQCRPRSDATECGV